MSRNRAVFGPDFCDFGANHATKPDFFRIQWLVFPPGLPEFGKAVNMFGLKQAVDLSFSLFWSCDVRGRLDKKEYR